MNVLNKFKTYGINKKINETINHLLKNGMEVMKKELGDDSDSSVANASEYVQYDAVVDTFDRAAIRIFKDSNGNPVSGCLIVYDSKESSYNTNILVKGEKVFSIYPGKHLSDMSVMANNKQIKDEESVMTLLKTINIHNVCNEIIEKSQKEMNLVKKSDPIQDVLQRATNLREKAQQHRKSQYDLG